jgi:hypothetical protein
MSATYPRIYARPDVDRLLNSCRGIDGSDLVRTVLSIQFDTGKPLASVLRSAEFRYLVEEMLDTVREKAGVA